MRAVREIQRLVLRSDRGPMRAVWRLAYRAAARGYGAYVTRGEPGASAYVRGTLASGEALAGLADIDVDVVVESADARRRVRERFRRAQRALPVVGELLFDWPSVFTRDELERTATQTAFTYGLDASPPAAAYLGHAADPQRARLLERPELYGPAHAWRRVAGPARPLPAAPRHPDTRRLVTWLELQNWWRWAFEACARPDRPWVGQLCVKLVADPFRAWCWLVDGDRIAGRVEALERGRERLPELAPAFERALRLHASLRAMPEPPLASAVADLLALSELIAREVARQVEPAGVTDVRLVDPRPRCFAFAHGGWSGGGRLFPLVDWHALVAGRGEPDEAFAIVDGDPREPAVLSELASARDRGPYPTLRHGELMLRPSTMGGRLNLRSVQCPAADPVSFALAEGRAVASFPNVPGWSIRDTARRAVAEHGAWLAAVRGRPVAPGFVPFALLVCAARAGLLLDSVEAGDPELPLTVDATLDALDVPAAVGESYHEHAISWAPPEAQVVEELRTAVERLPVYAGERRTLVPAS